MKISLKNMAISIMLLILFSYASYSNIIARATTGGSKYVLLAALAIFAVMANSQDMKLRIPSGGFPPYMMCWFLMALFVVSGITRVMFGSLQILVCIFFVLMCGSNQKWTDYSYNIAKIMLGVFVFFTFFFFVFPGTYRTVINFYGFIPDGTMRGQYPYRAGISSHYSINAINISLFFIITAIRHISKFGLNIKFEKGYRLNLLFCAISFVALVMTSKRGVLVWSMLAIAVAYIFIEKGKIGNIFKIAMAVLVLLGVLSLLAENVEFVNNLFERFRVVGSEEDNSSEQRFVMWQLALSAFAENPVFGIGFWKYRELYNANLSAIYDKTGLHTSIDAHNVYIQVLCETGIVGFVIYIAAIVFLLYRTVSLIKKIDTANYRDKYILSLSLALQLFYIFYSFSGNCFYDMTFFYYSFGMALTYSTENRYKLNSLQYNRQVAVQ